MDTPLHSLAVPDADPATLRRPQDSAREILELIDAAWNDATRRRAAAPSA
jgi:hypothetical protein